MLLFIVPPTLSRKYHWGRPRSDFRCGSRYKADCNTDFNFCCSDFGWCGEKQKFCMCQRCVDFRTDINECELHIDKCQHICNNTWGSYRCSCREGYVLLLDGYTCDFDECKSANHTKCDHYCTNTFGSYKCSCRYGYVLLSDGHTCAVDKCYQNNGGCEQRCLEKKTQNDTHRCACYEGHTLLDDNRSCRDIDECAEGLNHCEDKCVNHKGGHRCKCREGYTLRSDGITCRDYNECIGGTKTGQICDYMCENTPGSYKCSCRDGEVLDDDGHRCLRRLSVTSKALIGVGVLLALFVPCGIFAGSRRRRKLRQTSNDSADSDTHNIVHFDVRQETIETNVSPDVDVHTNQNDSMPLVPPPYDDVIGLPDTDGSDPSAVPLSTPNIDLSSRVPPSYETVLAEMGNIRVDSEIAPPSYHEFDTMLQT